MRNRTILFIIFLLCLHLLAFAVKAQDAATASYKNAFSVKAFGLSFHLKRSPHPEIFPNRLDDKGYTTLNYGAIAAYDRFVVRDAISIRLEQGLYADCAASLAGFTHVGLRGLIFRKGRHSLNGGIGPTLVFRRDWNRLPGYTDDYYFSRKRGWQYKFYWYAGELEYNYQLKKQTDFSLSLIPGLPELVALGVGLRQRF
ncbi:hypothetical protein [Botryobacter ruber]|uniref:hypothetical protein n=1 Tax=Botryobacter ruber TaxID=2171629 RepID=UPI00196B479A|nr:hypothetical protein [Botryobacter ruber]